MARSEDADLTISVSGVKERIVIYGFALLVGGATVLDLVTPHGRYDPNTGDEGRARDAAIHVLEERVTILELELEALKQRSNDCESRMDSHLSLSGTKINQYEIKFKELEILMNECLRRTGIR